MNTVWVVCRLRAFVPRQACNNSRENRITSVLNSYQSHKFLMWCMRKQIIEEWMLVSYLPVVVDHGENEIRYCFFQDVNASTSKFITLQKRLKIFQPYFVMSGTLKLVVYIWTMRACNFIHSFQKLLHVHRKIFDCYISLMPNRVAFLPISVPKRK